MFNVYEYDRRHQTLQQQEKLQMQAVKRAKQMRVKNKQLSEKYQERVGEFISSMINDPKEVKDELKALQKNNYEHQISRLGTQNKYPLGLDSSFMGRGDDMSIMEMTSQNAGPQININEEIQTMGVSRMRSANETQHLSPTNVAWFSHQNTVKMSNQREKTQASFFPGSTASNFQSKISQFNTSKIQQFDVTRRNNIGFRFSSTQRERIKLAQAAGSRLDCSPSALHEGSTYEKIMNLRPRQTEKELGPPSFRYRPNNYLEKVADTMRYQNPVNWGTTHDVFAPNLLNKKGELAKNLRPLPPGHEHDSKKRGDEGGKEEPDQDATSDGDGGGQQAESGSVSNADSTGKTKRKGLKIGGVWLKGAGQTSPPRTGGAKDLLPTLHAKTHFKAAVEYTLGPELTHRSLHDQRGKVEKTIFAEYQKTMEAQNRKVETAATSALPPTTAGDFGGTLTPGDFVHGQFAKGLDSKATQRGASVTLTKRLNIKRNQDQIADQAVRAEYSKMSATVPLSQAKSKTPAPIQRVGIRTATGQKEPPALKLDPDRLDVPVIDLHAKRGSLRPIAGRRDGPLLLAGETSRRAHGASPRPRQLGQTSLTAEPTPPASAQPYEDREVLSTQAKKMRDVNFNARQVTRQILKTCNVVREKGFDA